MGRNNIARYRASKLIHNLSPVNEELQTLLDRASPEQADALSDLVQAAFEAGQEDSDARTGRLMARIFGGFIGVTPGVDLENRGELSPRERVKSVVKILAGVTGAKIR